MTQKRRQKKAKRGKSRNRERNDISSNQYLHQRISDKQRRNGGIGYRDERKSVMAIVTHIISRALGI